MAEVRAHDMGWLQDIVPNHMAYSSENWMLIDVFENGPRSRFYEFFDVFRDHPDPELRTRVLAPFLGSPLEEVLRQGEMKLVLDADGLAVKYFTWRFPLHLSSYAFVLRSCGRRLSGPMAGDDSALQAFAGLPDRFTRLSEMDDSPEKQRQLAEAKGLLARLYSDNPIVNVCIDGVLDSFHRRPEGPVEQSPLYLLLDQQMFKPVFRQTACEKINYRRFFYLSEFISLRAEDPQVFHRTHDKILELGEFLRTDWPIQGTSGYKFCNYVNAIFCQRENERACTECRPEVNRVVQLLLSVPEREPESPSRQARRCFLMRFQQFTGPAMPPRSGGMRSPAIR